MNKSIGVLSLILLVVLSGCTRIEIDSNDREDSDHNANQSRYILDKPTPPEGYVFSHEDVEGVFHYLYYKNTSNDNLSVPVFKQWIESLGAKSYDSLPLELGYDTHDYHVFVDLHHRYYLALFEAEINNQFHFGILVFPLYYIEPGNVPLNDRYGYDSEHAPRYPESLRIDYFNVIDYWDDEPYNRELNHYISLDDRQTILNYYREYFVSKEYEIINEFDDLLEFKKGDLVISVHVMRSLNFHDYHDIKVGVSDFS